MRKLLLWLVMVAAMVAAILGRNRGLSLQPHRRGPLPQQPVQFGGLTLTANGWDWTIPFSATRSANPTKAPPT